MNIRHALIIAAGRGNRMRPSTDLLPKAMLPYKGDTLIGNSLAGLRECVSHVHVTVGYKSAMLAQYLMNVGHVGSIFNTEGRSNCWWIHNTLMRCLDEPVLLLTCDNITELDMGFLCSEYERAGEPACMVVPVRPLPMIEGDYIDQMDGVVTRLQRLEPTEIYCSGIQVLNPARVARLTIDAESFYSIWDQLIARRQLYASAPYPKAWFSVDTLDQLALARRVDGTDDSLQICAVDSNQK